MVGSATFTTRLSSIGMNRPKTMATSTSHLRRSDRVVGVASAVRSIVLAIGTSAGTTAVAGGPHAAEYRRTYLLTTLPPRPAFPPLPVIPGLVYAPRRAGPRPFERG